MRRHEIINELRRLYGGDAYATIFEDGTTIPWRPLSINDYIKYTKSINSAIIAPAFLEDEIFKKCVIEDVWKRQIDFLLAGIVSTVVQNIIQYSGPTGLDAFNADLDGARSQILDTNYSVLHELVEIILLAFPYKPEEVYDMDYETFLLRVAQAEKKLLLSGFLKEPVSLINKNVNNNMRQQRIKQFEDLKKRFEEERGLKKKQKQENKPVVQKINDPSLNGLEGTGKWWRKSPVLEAPNKTKIDFKLEQAEQETLVATGWEKVDNILEQDKMVQDAKIIYKDLIEGLEKRKRGNRNAPKKK